MVESKVFSDHSRAIQLVVQQKLDRPERSRLAEECAMLDPTFERAMAEEGLFKEPMRGQHPEWSSAKEPSQRRESPPMNTLA